MLKIKNGPQHRAVIPAVRLDSFGAAPSAKGIITAPLARFDANVFPHLITQPGFQIRVNIVIGHEVKTTRLGPEQEIHFLGKPDPSAL